VDINRVNEALNRIFNEEGHRIVFWNDPDLEFQGFLPLIQLDNVHILRLHDIGALEAKIRVERDDPGGRYLLYALHEEPDYEKDWLLDIRLYSRSFRADRASLILDDLGLTSHHLRQHLETRRKFFDSTQRLQKLKPLISPEDLETDLDRKMLAVVAKAEQPEGFAIVRTLFHAYTENGDEIDLDTPPAAWEQVEKLDLSDPFWQMVRVTFGYADEDPTLKKLLIRLMVTDFAHSLKTPVPDALFSLVLPPAGRANAVACLDQWRDSSSKAGSYDRLSEEVASLLRLEDHLHGLEIDALMDGMTFLGVEKALASGLRERVQGAIDTINPEEVRAVASRRQAGHWASRAAPGAAETPREALHAVYDALVAAAEFFALRNLHRQGFDFDTTYAMYCAYEQELYCFDQLYRHFCEAADRTESQGWNILKPLREAVEACYTNWYVPTLALAWGKFVDPRGSASLLGTWRMDHVHNQQEFYDRHVRSRLEEAENRKAYVVISDAFRYEAAQELTRELNGKYRFEATVSSHLGVLPSYTALGMASLLPHQQLTFKPGGEILVDGRSAASMIQRDEVLQAVDGMACRAEDLMAKRKEEGREFVSGKRVVYVYHNTVDAFGDMASTEGKTFDGVRKAIQELSDLVAYIINSLNGNHVVITADHGFLFTETPPGETEKSRLEDRPEGAVLSKKRYLIGQGLPDHDAVWHGSTATTAGAEGDMEFWIPKAANRFHFTGGARFVHGGAMLQEIVVPVITVRHRKDKTTRVETRVKPVPVQVLGGSHKITTGRHRFELIQMEPVSERVKPVTLKVAVYEGEDPVTNIESVTFDSASDRMDERKKWVQLVLQDHPYNKKTSYRLVLRDAETGIEQQGVTVTIDRAFDDF